MFLSAKISKNEICRQKLNRIVQNKYTILEKYGRILLFDSGKINRNTYVATKRGFKDVEV